MILQGPSLWGWPPRQHAHSGAGAPSQTRQPDRGAAVQAAEAAAADRRRASLQGKLARRSLRRSSFSHTEPAAGSSLPGASAGQAHKGNSPEPARQCLRSLSRQTSRPASSSSAAAPPQAPARAQTPGQPGRPGTAAAGQHSRASLPAAGEQTPGFTAAKARCRACLNSNHVHWSVSNRQTVNGTMPRQGNCGTHSLCGVKRADQPCMAQVRSEPWACPRRVVCTHGHAGLPPALPATVCQPFCVPGQCRSGPVSPATHLQASVCTAQSATGQARPAPDGPDQEACSGSWAGSAACSCGCPAERVDGQGSGCKALSGCPDAAPVSGLGVCRKLTSLQAAGNPAGHRLLLKHMPGSCRGAQGDHDCIFW